MISKPLISLDYTLFDLYATDSDGKPPPVQFYHPLRFKDDAVSPAKLVYHFGPQGEKPAVDATAAAASALTMKMIPQRYGFSAGKLRMIILDTESSSAEQGSMVQSKYHSDICNGFSQLREDQRPILSFTTDLKSLALDSESGLTVILPSDCASHIPHAIDPEIHYELLSKRGLALSGLPTPRSLIIDTLLQPDQVHDPHLLEQDIDRMVRFIDTYQIPFMVKLPQSIAGKGVFAARSDPDRPRIKEMLRIQMRRMLTQMNATNHHLHPCSLVLQDYVPGTVVALSLFVSRNGRPTFVACCEQRFDTDGYWVGGCISYPDQPALHQRYADTMGKVAEFLHQKGFYGPAGVDIVTSEKGLQYIIDLNARVTGTHFLGPLAGHFRQRGLAVATMMTEFFPCSRLSFEETFREEILGGSVIISGWVEDESIQLSHGTITVGASGVSEMQRLVAKVESCSTRWD